MNHHVLRVSSRGSSRVQADQKNHRFFSTRAYSGRYLHTFLLAKNPVFFGFLKILSKAAILTNSTSASQTGKPFLKK